jgi:hypothetical protein
MPMRKWILGFAAVGSLGLGFSAGRAAAATPEDGGTEGSTRRGACTPANGCRDRRPMEPKSCNGNYGFCT